MKRHVDLLGTLASIWGALAMLVGVSMLLLAAGALTELLAPVANRVDFAAGLTAAVFALIGVFALIWGGAHVGFFPWPWRWSTSWCCHSGRRSAPTLSGCCFATMAGACSSRQDKIG